MHFKVVFDVEMLTHRRPRCDSDHIRSTRVLFRMALEPLRPRVLVSEIKRRMVPRGVKDKANVIAIERALMFACAAGVIRNFAKLPQ